MKKAAFGFLLMVFFACKKDSPKNPVPPGNLNNKLEYDITISGATRHWSDSGNNVNFLSTVIGPGNPFIIVSNDTVAIGLQNINTPGSYIFGQPKTDSTQFYDVVYGYAAGSYYDWHKGQIILTTITSTHITGTFEASFTSTGNGEIEITNGKFNGDLTSQ